MYLCVPERPFLQVELITLLWSELDPQLQMLWGTYAFGGLSMNISV
jgi:hypothetical protein